MRQFFLLFLCFVACKNQPTSTSQTATTILKHKYWVSKPFHDALFAARVVDTLAYLPCAELLFPNSDTVLITTCLSDAGAGIFKSTGSNSMEITFAGMEDKKPVVARFDENSGVLFMEYPAGYEDWPQHFVAHDAIDPANIDFVTINLGRKRLSGQYAVLPQKGQVATTALVELKADGSLSGLGDYSSFEPWPSGIGGGAISEPPTNLMYLLGKDKEAETVLGWQASGDTLKLWETQLTSPEGDMPAYKRSRLKGIYLKTK